MRPAAAPGLFCFLFFCLLFDTCRLARALLLPLASYLQNPVAAKDVMGSINVEIPHGNRFRFRGQFHDKTERNNEHHHHNNNNNKASHNPNLVYLSSGHTELYIPR